MGVSFVSVENARLNLDREQAGKDFEKIHAEARSKWNDDLSRITVEGGTDAQKTVFYTALYHLLIHPNILQDVNGEYPAKVIAIPYFLFGILTVMFINC